MPRLLACCLLLVHAWAAPAEEVTVDHHGLLLNGNLRLAASQRMADEIILMLHGTLGHKDMEIMSTLQSIFAEYGRNTLAINLGLNVNDRQGFYPCDDRHTHRNDDAGDELQTWLSWLASRRTGEIVLLGHSRGARQIARFIVANDPPVRAAILIAPPVESDSPGSVQESALPSAQGNKWLDDVPFLHCDNATVSGESYLSYYDLPADERTIALLEKISVPVLVLSGSDDRVVAGLEGRMANIGNNLVRHRQIEDADHFFRDLYAYDLVDLAVEFLDERLSGTDR